MASRRDQITMSDAEVAAYLDEQRVLNVATIGPSGHPHVVAMWYTMLDGRPAFWTFAKSQKVVNLRRDPKITGLVESGDSYDELRGVELVGTARLIEDYDADPRHRAAGGVEVQGARGAERRRAAVHRGPGAQAHRRRHRRRAHGHLGPHEARRRLLTRAASPNRRPFETSAKPLIPTVPPTQQ